MRRALAISLVALLVPGLVDAQEAPQESPSPVDPSRFGDAFEPNDAIGKPPADSPGINLPVLLRAITKVLGWRLRGRAWPTPFFQPKTREPVYPVKVLAQEQREALRPLCGPRAA